MNNNEVPERKRRLEQHRAQVAEGGSATGGECMSWACIRVLLVLTEM